MNFVRFALVSLATLTLGLGSAACSQSAAPEEETTEGALENRGAATGSAISLGIDFVSIQASVKATEPDPSFPEMTSCETNVEYVSISGTKFDAQINALLKGGNEAPTTCTVPETIDSKASIKFLGKNFISVASSGGWYSVGAAHPSYGRGFTTIDLTTGKAVNLAQLVKPEARDTMLRSLRAQIGAAKERYKGQDGRMIVEKLDETAKRSLLDAAKYMFEQPLEKIEAFSLATTGVRIDLVNELPHAYQGAPSEYIVRWETLDKAGAILPAVRDRLMKK